MTGIKALPAGESGSPEQPDNSAAPAIFNGQGFLLSRLAAGATVLHPPPSPRPDGSPAPFVMDDGLMRTLHFDPGFVQSEMSLEQPYALKLAYTRQMMAFLLFLPRPRHIAIIGLGGGSLTKFCYRQLPQARITTVEIDRGVIDCAAFFQMPAEDERLRIVHADAVDYFAAAGECTDAILIDGCDRSGIVAAFRNERFYRNLRARLHPGGMLVVNLIGADAALDEHQRLIAEVFEERCAVQYVAGEGNRIAYAFNPPRRAPDWLAIEREARRLARRHELDFPAYARRLQRSFWPAR